MFSACSKIRGKVVCTGIILFLIFFTVINKTSTDSGKAIKVSRPLLATEQLTSEPLWQQTLDFDELNFDNRTGHPSGCYLVPNYIHYVTFGGKPVSYVQLICILAAYKNQRPDKIFFHHDDKNTFTGKYWDVLEKTPGFNDVVVFNRVELPTQIFGQPLSGDWQKWHGSDVVRIQMLMKYGGVYLDADSYLVKSIDDFRRFEMTLNWDEDQFLGNQVLIAHKDARFLKKYLDTYKQYDKEKWYYNGGEKPTVEILYKKPELIHRVKVLFGADIKFALKLFQQQWDGWVYMYVIHLLYNHQYLFQNLSSTAVFPVDLNENNIAYYDMTFREMAYDVYKVANVNWHQDRILSDSNTDKIQHKRFIKKL